MFLPLNSPGKHNERRGIVVNLLTGWGEGERRDLWIHYRETQDEFCESRFSHQTWTSSRYFCNLCIFLYFSRRNAVVSAENHRLVPETGIRHVFAHGRVDILFDVLLGAVAHVRCGRQRGHTDTVQAGRTAGRQWLHAAAGPTGMTDDAIVFYRDQHATDAISVVFRLFESFFIPFYHRLQIYLYPSHFLETLNNTRLYFFVGHISSSRGFFPLILLCSHISFTIQFLYFFPDSFRCHNLGL